MGKPLVLVEVNLVFPTIAEIVFVRKPKTSTRLRNDVTDHGFQRVGTNETVAILAQ